MSATKQVMEKYAEALSNGNLNDNTGREFGITEHSEMIYWTYQGFLWAIMCQMELPDTPLIRGLYAMAETLDWPEYEDAIDGER